ncbi:MAG: hypothetical protein AAB197_01720, partial [Deltaproteobacteria bacterium]
SANPAIYAGTYQYRRIDGMGKKESSWLIVHSSWLVVKYFFAISYELSAIQGGIMKREGVRSKTISSERINIENKTIWVDLKENEGGKFLQIAELSNDRRSTVVIPHSGLSVFLEAVQKISVDSKE